MIDLCYPRSCFYVVIIIIIIIITIHLYNVVHLVWRTSKLHNLQNSCWFFFHNTFCTKWISPVNFLFYINDKVFYCYLYLYEIRTHELTNMYSVPSKISFALCSFVSFIVQFGYKQCYLDTCPIFFLSLIPPQRHQIPTPLLDSKGYLVCLLNKHPCPCNAGCKLFVLLACSIMCCSTFPWAISSFFFFLFLTFVSVINQLRLTANCHCTLT